MRPHVHDESESASGGDHLYRWDATRMRKHLRNVHDIQAPMSWDLGRLHQAHLEDHHKTPGWTQPPAQAEEAPMTETQTKDHEHEGVGGIDGFHRRIKEVHGPVATTFLRAHLSLMHGRTGLDDVTDHEALEDMHAVLHEETPALADPVPEQRVGTPEERHADHRIMVDRLTAVMAGLDFDREWAADDGIGPNARGALRVTFQRAAEQTLRWLERGGLAVIPGYLELLNEQVLQERDEARTRQAEAVEKWQEAVRLGREQQRSMQEMAQAVSESESLVSDLEEINNQLREQLATTGRQLQTALSQKDGLFSEMGELRARLEDERAVAMRRALEAEARAAELSTQLELLSGDLEAVTADRDEARDERDRAQQAVMTKYGETGELRQKLADLVAELKDSGWSGSSVFQKLVAIVSSGVSTVTEASQAPIESVQVHGPLEPGTKVTVTLGGREIDAGGVIESVLDDDLSWARRFAEGGEV